MSLKLTQEQANMSLAQKSNNANTDWQPSASIETLKLRAGILSQIREFFDERGVLEVETPLLSHASVTDPYIQSIPALFQSHPNQLPHRYYLQTSPEYAMKRLLAAGSGPIFQITKAFRQGEVGHLHNPEFTLLEWYRPGFNHHDLMNEVDELLQSLLNTQSAERISYQEAFETLLNINPHLTNLTTLKHCADEHGIILEDEPTDIDTWLQLLMSHCIEPKIGQDKPCIIYDFPAEQAALARLITSEPPVAARFEVYYKGIELANAFYELQDAHTQRKRFEANLEKRKQLKLDLPPIDENLLASLDAGLPDCSGIALGIDRLVMLALNQTNIQTVLSFDFSRA